MRILPYFCHIVLLIYCSPLLFAEDGMTPFEYTKKIKEQLDGLKNVSPELYQEEIISYREQIERYIQHKKGVCNGEFSVFILSDQKASTIAEEQSEEKLSEHERMLCFRELKAIHVTFINSSFEARKRYILYQHKKLLAGLDQVRSETIDKVHQSYSEKSLKRKRVKKKRNKSYRRRGR